VFFALTGTPPEYAIDINAAKSQKNPQTNSAIGLITLSECPKTIGKHTEKILNSEEKTK
jgi:hypothetical protein